MILLGQPKYSTKDTERKIAAFGIAILLCFGSRGLIRWLLNGPLRPDPRSDGDNRSRKWCRRRGSNPRNGFRLPSLIFVTICKSKYYVRRIKKLKMRGSEQKRTETNKSCQQLSSKNGPSN